MQRGLSAKAGAGALAAAYFASAGSNYPNASFPGWNEIAYNLNIVAQVRGIAWLPLVTPAQLNGFWAFANSTIGVQWANASLQHCGYVNATDYAAGQATVTRNVQGGLFAGNATNHKPYNTSAAYYFPLIHHAPIHTNEAVIMFDLNSEAVRARAISTVLATQAAATTDWLRLVQDVNANQNRIASLALTPVVVNGAVVGISNTVFNWDSVLLQALPAFITGIDAVLSSGLSNRTFTMRLTGGSVLGIGVGDLHETDDDLAKYTRSISATLGTTWTITLHPTRELRNSYFTTGPRDRCIAVLVVIIVCIFLFILHDWLARSRSLTLIRLVKATSRIVDDLFPRTVRSRLVKAALAEQAPEPEAAAPLSQGATKALGLIQKYIGLEAAQTRAVSRRSSVLVAETGAIADTFPAVTVLFSDIVVRIARRGHRAPVRMLTHCAGLHVLERRRAARDGVPRAGLHLRRAGCAGARVRYIQGGDHRGRLCAPSPSLMAAPPLRACAHARAPPPPPGRHVRVRLADADGGARGAHGGLRAGHVRRRGEGVPHHGRAAADPRRHAQRHRHRRGAAGRALPLPALR